MTIEMLSDQIRAAADQRPNRPRSRTHFELATGVEPFRTADPEGSVRSPMIVADKVAR
ncbi:hypothetical protein ACIO14_29130 [Nocardia fluminea]|uniref:hypothetical protein n=1 Tax=Nocardia fluminea TaxID=134984 RepID=UPI0038136198